MKKRLIVLLGFLLIVAFNLFAQDSVLAQAKNIIMELTSDSFYGRGYVNKGDSIAASFIAKYFKNNQVQNINGSYFQQFSHSVNTFPGSMKCVLKGESTIDLKPGLDFLVHPATAGAKGSFKIYEVNCNHLNSFSFNKNENGFVLIDTNGKSTATTLKELERFLFKPPIGVKGVIISKKVSEVNRKPGDWNISPISFSIPVLEIVNDLLKDVKNIEIDIESKFIKKYFTQNVIGFIKGTTMPDSFIVVSAHYDHLGMMGEHTFFRGANDNATGIAMLLLLSEYFSKAENQPKKSILFIAFGAEEAGLVGSNFYVKNPFVKLDKINFLLNFDLLGTGDEGITVVNASVFKKEFEQLQQLNSNKKYINTIKQRGKAANSDHYYFSERGVPSFYWYTLGGIKAYHDVHDIAATLPLTAFVNVYNLAIDFLKLKLNP